jgi:hypothetical protein
MNRATQVLAEGLPPGIRKSYRALADYGKVPHTTFHRRACSESLVFFIRLNFRQESSLLFRVVSEDQLQTLLTVDAYAHWCS